MPFVNGIRIYDLVKEFQEGIGEQGPFASRSWLVPSFDDRYLVANGLLGLSTLTGGTSGTTSFTRPLSYPDSVGLLARDVSIRGVGVPSVGANQIRWESAIVSANFAVPTFSIEYPNGDHEISPADPLIYASQSLSFGNQVITIPKNKLKVGAKTLEQPMGLPTRTVTLKVTFHKLPFLIPQYVRDHVGDINNATFLGCPVGTLLFDGIETQREFQSDGSISQETSITLINRPKAAWNKIRDPDDGTWQAVTFATGGGSILDSFDMSVLIPTGYRA